jgi:hypothetical protein
MPAAAQFEPDRIAAGPQVIGDIESDIMGILGIYVTQPTLMGWVR